MTKYLVSFNHYDENDDYSNSSWDDNFCYFNTREEAEAFIIKAGADHMNIEEIQEGYIDHNLWFYFNFDANKLRELMLLEVYKSESDSVFPIEVDLPPIKVVWISYNKPVYEPLQQAIGYEIYMLVEATDYTTAVEVANARLMEEGIILNKINRNTEVVGVKFNIKQVKFNIKRD